MKVTKDAERKKINDAQNKEKNTGKRRRGRNEAIKLKRA
jgi:hypothetical protein